MALPARVPRPRGILVAMLRSSPPGPLPRRLRGLARALALSVLFSTVGPGRAAHGPREPDLAQLVAEVVERSNAFRASQGLPPVVVNPLLVQAAAGFASYLARTDEFGHTADGRDPAARAKSAGYAMCMIAENLALEGSSAGFETSELAADFVDGWIASPGHRANLLAPEATETGVAVARSERSGHYVAVQMFGRPESMRVAFDVANRTQFTWSYRYGATTYALPPAARRMHASCGGEKLEVELPGRQPPLQVAPANGASYRFEATGGGGVRFVQAQ
jgi:uncharacterized protein YkwD